MAARCRGDPLTPVKDGVSLAQIKTPPTKRRVWQSAAEETPLGQRKGSFRWRKLKHRQQNVAFGSALPGRPLTPTKLQGGLVNRRPLNATFGSTVPWRPPRTNEWGFRWRNTPQAKRNVWQRCATETPPPYTNERGVGDDGRWVMDEGC